MDILTDIVQNYNSTPHRSLNDLPPRDVNKDNEADVWAYLYLKNVKSEKGGKKQLHATKKQRSIKYRYKVNDLVRLSHLKHIFPRGYNQQLTGGSV